MGDWLDDLTDGEIRRRLAYRADAVRDRHDRPRFTVDDIDAMVAKREDPEIRAMLVDILDR